MKLNKLTICLICITLTISSAFVQIKLPQAQSMYLIPDENTRTILVENTKIKKAKVKKYSRSSGYYSYLSFQNKAATMFYKKGTLEYNLKTLYYLPVKRKSNYGLSLMQSIAIKGNYLFVLYREVLNPGWNQQKGFIAKYDINKLKKLGLNVGGKKPEDLRRAFVSKVYKTKKVSVKTKVWRKINGKWHLVTVKKTVKKEVRDKVREKKIKQAVTFSKSFVVGHGQTLNLSPDGNFLLLSAEGENPKPGEDVQIYKISMNSLKVTQVYETDLNEDVAFSKVWTIDDEGNVFTIQKKNEGYSIYQGILDDDMTLNEVMQIKYRNGDTLQGATYNRLDGKIYILCDGSIMSMPADKIGSLDMTDEDIDVTTFYTDREFEGIAFDKKGKMYLTVIRGPELLVADRTFK